MKIKTYYKTKGGFTLIEMLVSLALFTIVMTVSLSVIVSLIDGNKRTQSINSVVNNLNSSIDSMVRDLKTGIEYRCNSNLLTDHLPIANYGAPSDCASAGTVYKSIDFISTITGTPRSVNYKWIEGDVDAGTPGYIEKTTCSPAGICTSARITSPEINVQDMRMYVKDGSGSPHTQPGILLVIGGTARVNPTTVSNFYLQTFVSRRVLNI